MHVLRTFITTHWSRVLLALFATVILVGLEVAPTSVQGYHLDWYDSCNNDFGYAPCDAYEANAAARCAADGGSFGASCFPQMCEGTTCASGFCFYSCSVPHPVQTCATNPTMDGCACSKSNACNTTSGSYSGGSCNAPEPAPCQVCAPNMGQACPSYPNVCGGVGWGTIQCNGSCSASIPGVSDACPADPGLQCSASECSPSCTPSSSCAWSTCQGSVCYDSCGNGYAGVLDCSPPPGGDPAPTASLSASPTTIASGGSSTLTWSSSNATSCTGGGFSTGNATSGTRSVSPSSTSTYTLQCTGPGGSVTRSATVTVTAGGGSCTGAGPIEIEASPSRVQPGGSTTLTWSGSNIGSASCTLTNLNTGSQIGSAAVASCTVGSQSTPVSGINAQTTFRLACGSLVKDVIVNIVPRFEEF